jgi:hypothetical protein
MLGELRGHSLIIPHSPTKSGAGKDDSPMFVVYDLAHPKCKWVWVCVTQFCEKASRGPLRVTRGFVRRWSSHRDRCVCLFLQYLLQRCSRGGGPAGGGGMLILSSVVRSEYVSIRKALRAVSRMHTGQGANGAS